MLALCQLGYSHRIIKERLEQEDINVTTRSLQRLDKNFHDEGTFRDLPRNKRSKKLSQPMIKFLNDKLEGDELTSTKLRELLMQNWPDLNVSLTTVKRYQRKQGWVCTRPHYCQLIQHMNKRKRVAWCKEAVKSKDYFADIIFSVE